MGKIIRISLKNIKKHKLESFSLALLVMFCMLLLGSSLASFPSVKTIFPDMMKETEAWENYILFNSKGFDPKYISVLEQDENVTGTVRVDMLYDMSTRYIDKDGKKQALFMAFITEDEEAKIEKSIRSHTLSDEEIAGLEHPIFLPFIAEDSLGLKPGDTFEVVCGTRIFPFTVAGFYESVIFNDLGLGLKMIVNDKDYATLSGVLQSKPAVFFNTKEKDEGLFAIQDFDKRIEEQYNKNMADWAEMMDYYKDMEQSATMSIKILLALMIVMAVVIFVCVAFMIWYRITNDIKEQMTSIGVLEALGYTSRNVAFSYAFEYVIIAVAGILLGAVGSLFLAPAIFHSGEKMVGFRGVFHGYTIPIIAAAVIILVFVSAVSFIKSSVVKKYPPVMTLRKGIADHHFGKERFSLRKTKSSVHLRLAMKGFAQNIGQSIGLAACMTLAVTAVLSSFILYNALGRNSGFVRSIAGLELSDIKMSVTYDTDAEAFADELRKRPEVRKILLNNSSSTDFLIELPEQEIVISPVVYDDYSQTENIKVLDGRFPENDNEIMVTKVAEKMVGTKLGDSIVVKSGSNKQSYIISGVVSSITNGGANFYLTESGMKRLNPNYRPFDLEIYLNKDVDKEEFRAYLTNTYGRSLNDLQEENNSSCDYEERIKVEAEKRIAELMTKYGVSHVEYAITSGDTVVTGNNSDFHVRSFINISDILDTQLSNTTKSVSMVTCLFTVISAIVVMIILFILMSSTVKKQRRDLGIMKGMGYTSRELMLQLAFRIVPASITAVILGTLLAHLVTGSLSGLIGSLMVSIPAIIAVDVLILVFCFVCAYVGARKIKKISVYELMTE